MPKGDLKPAPICRYHIFLASPGDVEEHRKFVRSFFGDYNIQHAAAKGIEFQVVDWENHATLGIGETQKRITVETLEKHRESLALVIGILGQRFGSKTSTHESGTEEEFEWALHCWKEDRHPEIKWFFLDPDQLRLPAERNEARKALDQWDKVCAFRERLKTGRPERGDPQLYTGTFQCLETFRENFRRDLNLWLGAAERPWNEPPPKTHGNTRETETPVHKPPAKHAKPRSGSSNLLVAYLNRVREETGKISLIGLGQDLQVELDILEAYVPLQTVAARALVPDPCETVRKPGGWERSAEREPPVDVNLVFSRAAEYGQRGVVLLGDPGAGKTTVARQLVFSLASGRVPPKNLGLPAGIAPVFLRFRNLAPSDLKSEFNAFLERELSPIYEDTPERRRAVREAILNRPCLLWVLDGLDEVVEEKLRAKARDWVARLMKDRPDDYFLVTSRFQGYRGKAELGGAFVEFHVQPLEPEQSRQFIRRWYEEVCGKLKGKGARARQDAEQLIQSLTGILDGPTFQVGRMPELPSNPLLLTILCVVHHQDRNLPRRRADLYGRCVRVLLEYWRWKVWEKQGAKPFDAPSAERVLAELAWRMHQEQGRTAMDVRELATAAEPTLLKMPEDAGLGRDGTVFLQQMRDRSGIMAMVGEGRCAFLHLTFQEYLAARHAESRTLTEDLAGHFGQTWWREAVLLAMAMGQPEFVEGFLEKVLETRPWEEHLDLLGQCLDEARNPELKPFIHRLENVEFSKEKRLRLLRLLAARHLPALAPVAERLAEAETGEARSLLLQMARRTLPDAVGAEATSQPPARANEPGAVQVDTRTSLEFVWIPPGEFLMGGKSEYDGKPIHLVKLTQGFWLGRYTVTNKDYRKFVEATGHQKPAYWSHREFNADQQPVVGVSWEDATAYCEWGGFRLPTEAEWEYACRADSDGAYCYGDGEEKLKDFAWYVKNSDGKLRQVGQKKPNKWGLYDMHGSVWEWCQDWFGEYSKEAVTDPNGAKGGSNRVVRGGSWNYSAGGCRSAWRNGVVPAFRYSNVGFRVVLARSSVHGPEKE